MISVKSVSDILHARSNVFYNNVQDYVHMCHICVKKMIILTCSIVMSTWQIILMLFTLTSSCQHACKIYDGVLRINVNPTFSFSCLPLLRMFCSYADVTSTIVEGLTCNMSKSCVTCRHHFIACGHEQLTCHHEYTMC